MKLDSLTLSRGYSNEKPLTGTATFSTPDEHKLTIKLNEDDAVAITELCAVAIARIGRETAEALTADALQFTALEHQS